MRERVFSRLAALLLALFTAVSSAGCSISVNENQPDESVTPTGKFNIKKASPTSQPQSAKSADKNEFENLVINDFPISEDRRILETKNGSVYILLDSEIITSVLKLPYSTSVYPELSTQNGQISLSWSNEDKVVLKVDMAEGSDIVYVNESNEPIDIVATPRTVEGKLFIPINIFLSALKMKDTYDEELDTTLIGFEENFPEDLLLGNWSDQDTDIFTTFQDVTTGQKSLSSFAAGYRFNRDGTYNLLMISVGGFQDKAVQNRGKYKILGNTIIYYDTYETLYEGTPFKLAYKNKKLENPSFDFISDYDPDKDRMEIAGMWLNKIGN